MLSLSPGWRGQPYIAQETVKDLGAAQYLAAHASPGDPIVVMGYRRSVTAYYLDRARRPYTLRSFPAELAEHPGWFSASRLLRDRERLAQEGEALARELVTAARQGRTVWSSPRHSARSTTTSTARSAVSWWSTVSAAGGT